MKKTITRTLAAAVLGTTLAVGGAALAALPASAATTVTVQGTTGDYVGTVALNPGTKFNHTGIYDFSTPVKSVTYTVQGVGTGFALSDVFAGQTVNWDANNSATVTTGTGKFTFTKLSPTSTRITIDYNNPGTTMNLFIMDPINTSPTAQGTFTWNVESVTPSSTGVAEAITGAPKVTKVVTWGNFVDTPVIAPLIAGIALLGAAGAGGGIALSRRKKAQANA
ncbi:hypothetical protein ACRAWB_14500 [Leifsonia poae]|uniref:hypothetical protein n=1 Tax=Leifsonia poae TaxID=110933 RepID=UPI003D685040